MISVGLLATSQLFILHIALRGAMLKPMEVVSKASQSIAICNLNGWDVANLPIDIINLISVRKLATDNIIGDVGMLGTYQPFRLRIALLGDAFETASLKPTEVVSNASQSNAICNLNGWDVANIPTDIINLRCVWKKTIDNIIGDVGMLATSQPFRLHIALRGDAFETVGWKPIEVVSNACQKCIRSSLYGCRLNLI